jgi:hypothetical protein
MIATPKNRKPMRNLAVVACVVAAVMAVTASQAFAFGGAALVRPAGGIGVTFDGTAFPRLLCAGGTNGFCTGTITIRRGSRVLGSAPMAIRSGDGPSVAVPLKGGHSAPKHGSVTVTTRTHDSDGNFRTVTQSSHLKAG